MLKLQLIGNKARESRAMKRAKRKVQPCGGGCTLDQSSIGCARNGEPSGVQSMWDRSRRLAS